MTKEKGKLEANKEEVLARKEEVKHILRGKIPFEKRRGF